MAIKPLHAGIVAAAICVVLVIAKPWRTAPPHRAATVHSLRDEYIQLRSAASLAASNWRSAAQRDSVLAIMRSRERVGPREPLILAGGGWYPEQRDLSARVLARAWRGLGIDSMKVPVVLLVLRDTVGTWEFDAGSNTSVEFLLPSDAAGAGAPCISVARIGTSSRNLQSLARALQFGVRSYYPDDAATTAAGPCAFFAAFGHPGHGIATWLEGQQYTYATSSNWARPQGDVRDAFFLASKIIFGAGNNSDIDMTSTDLRKCWLGNLDVCERLLLMPSQKTVARKRLPGVYDGDFYNRSWARGDAEKRLLADMHREIGAEKFAVFWTSPDDPATAFQTATGERLGAWTHRWVGATYGATLPGARIPASAVGWGLLVAVGCVTVAAITASRRTVG